MSAERIVVIGASAGGVDALLQLVRQLQPGFPAPICIVLHIPAQSPSVLGEILTRTGNLPAANATHGEMPRAGRIYLAPPDHHLLIGRDGTLHVARGPRENRHRPAVDPLFRSAALRYGPNAIGVILSGALDDGTAGLYAVKSEGGATVVQDPKDALFTSMPESALANVEVDHVVTIADMGELLLRLASEKAGPRRLPPPRELELEVNVAELEKEALHQDERPGNPSPYSCPDCGGVLWEIEEGDLAHFRCRVGHAFSPDSMLDAQDHVLEEALWSAMKTLEESARLSQRLAIREQERGHDWLAKRFEEKEHDARARVEVIRRHLLRGNASSAAK